MNYTAFRMLFTDLVSLVARLQPKRSTIMDTLPVEMVSYILRYVDVLSWARARVGHRLFHVDTQRECARRVAEGRQEYPAAQVCVYCFCNVEHAKKRRSCNTCGALYCSSPCRKWHRNNNHKNKQTRCCLRCWLTVGTYSPLFAMVHGYRYRIPKDQIDTRKRVANLLASGVLCNTCHESHRKWANDTHSQQIADDHEAVRIVKNQKEHESDIAARHAHNYQLIKLSRLDVARRRTVTTVEWLCAQPRHLRDRESYAEALENACERGNDALVYALLQRGAPYENVCLELACLYNHVSLVHMLLPNAQCQPSANDSNSLRVAARDGHTKIVCTLLRDGRANPSACQNAALVYAAKNGHTDVLSALLGDSRVDPTRGDVLRASLHSRNERTVSVLLADERIRHDFATTGDPYDLIDVAIRRRLWTIMGHLLVALEPIQCGAIVSRLHVEEQHQYALYCLRHSMRLEGMRWLRRAAQDYNIAALECGHQEREAGNVEMAVHYYLMAIRNSGSLPSAEGLYWCAVATGDCGQDARAVDYLQKAIGREQHLASMVRLGEYYAHRRGSGTVVPYDMRRARDLWKQVITDRRTGTFTADAQRLLDETIARRCNY